MKPIAVYRDIEAFYDDRGGRFIGEVDSGRFNRNNLDWTSDGPSETGVSRASVGGQPALAFQPAHAGLMRVSTVKTTGDTYAVNDAAQGSPVALLGTIALPDVDDTYSHINMVFDGYAEGPTLGKPLSWFMSRIKERGK